MHTTSRILTKEHTFESNQEAHKHILACLLTAPGLNKVKSLSRHPKGGFIFAVDMKKEESDAFVKHIDNAGFFLGI